MHWKDDRIASSLTEENPTVILRMPSGFAQMGETQFLPGYCVLLATPKVGSLNDLPLPARLQFLQDMTLIGDAITRVCKPLRINYGILGNTDTYLHAHIYPRYEWESEERRPKNVWRYPPECWTAPEHQFSSETHGKLQQQLREALEELLAATS